MNILSLNKTHLVLLTVIITAVFMNVYVKYLSDYKRIDIQSHHERLIEKNVEVPNRYRILLPYTVEFGLKNLFNAQTYNYYRLLDFVLLSLGFWSLFILLNKFVGLRESIIGIFFAFLTLPFAYLKQAYFTTSFEFFFFCLGLLLLFDKKYFALLVLIFFGIFNRATSVFLILTFITVYWKILPAKKYYFWSGMYFILFIAVQLFLRNYLGDGAHANRGILVHISLMFTRNVTTWKFLLFPIVMLNMLWIFSFYGFKDKPEFIRRIILVLPLMVFFFLIFGSFIEVRIFMPMLPYMVLSSVWTLFNSEKPLIKL